MADQESVSFEIDPRSVVSAIGQMNKAIEGFEKGATTSNESLNKSFQRVSDLLLKMSDRSRDSMERQIRSVEKLAAAYGRTGVERLISQRDQLIKRLGSEQNAIDRVTASYAKMIAIEKGSNGGSFEGFGRNVQQFVQSPLQASTIAATNFLEKIGPMGAVVAGGTIALGAFAVAGFEAAKSLGSYADSIGDTSVRTGLSIREVGEYSFAMRRAGGDISQVEGIMRKLSQGLADSSDEGRKSREGLRDLGIATRTANGDIRPMAELLPALVESLNKLPEGAARNTAALKVMGRGALDALPDLLELNEGLRRARELGIAPSNDEIRRWNSYQQQVAEASSLWDKLVRKIKEPIAVPVLFILKWATSGNLTGAPTDKGQRGGLFGLPDIGSPGETDIAGEARRRMQAEMGMAAIAGDFQSSGAARSLGSYLKGSGSIESAQARLRDLKEDYDKTRVTAEQLANSGSVLPAVAQRQRTEVESALTAYRRQADLVKEMEKDESRRIGNLERIRDLIFEGSQALIGGSGRGQFIVTGQDIYDANRSAISRSRGPSLVRPGEYRPIGSEFGGDSINLPEGMQLGAGWFFVSPQSVRISPAEQEQLAARGAGFGLSEQRRRELELGTVRARGGAAAQMADIAGLPGQEMQTARNVAQIRQSALTDELRITGDIANYRLSSLHNELELSVQIAQIRRQQFNSVSSTSAGLVNTFFTQPRSFGRQLGSTIGGAVLKPITEGLGGLAARALTPLIFGAGGNGGIAGGIKGLFGGNQDPVKSTDMNTQATMENTAAMRSLSSQLSMGMSAMVGGGSSDPLSMLLGSGKGGGGLAVGGFKGGLSGLSGLFSKATLTGLKGLVFNSGSIQTGAGTANTAAGIGGIGGKLAGVASSPLAGFGGMLLAQQSLMGSWAGTKMGILGGAAGGALVGFQFGGPIGAAIGAIVGATIGIGEMIAGVEPKWKQAIRLIQEQYHVGINRDMGEQIAAVAKQKYTGHVSMAVQDPDIRRMIELYAAATGQRMALSATMPRAGSLVEQGGRLFQSPGFQFGRPYTFESSLPVAGNYNTGTYPSARTTAPEMVSTSASVAHILDQHITPDFVQAKFSAAQRSSSGRLQNAALFAQPGLITS